MRKDLRTLGRGLGIFSPPCGALSRLQNMTPDEKRLDLDKHRREVREAEGFLDLCVEGCLTLAQRGGYFLMESARGTDAWRRDSVQRVCSLPGSYTVAVGARAVGLLDKVSKLPFGKKLALRHK